MTGYQNQCGGVQVKSVALWRNSAERWPSATIAAQAAQAALGGQQGDAVEAVGVGHLGRLAYLHHLRQGFSHPQAVAHLQAQQVQALGGQVLGEAAGPSLDIVFAKVCCKVPSG